jgi:hypothetical protein
VVGTGAPALKCNNLVYDREGLWQRDTEGHNLRSGVAMRIMIARGVWQFGCRPEVNAMQAIPAVRCGTTRVSETGCSHICSKTWCDALGRLRRGETVRLCMPRLDGTCETRCERLDRARAAHNPEVGGSNPPPATENCLMA